MIESERLCHDIALTLGKLALVRQLEGDWAGAEAADRKWLKAADR